METPEEVQVKKAHVEELMLIKIKSLIEKGYTNPSAIAGIIGGCWYPTLGDDKKYLIFKANGFMEVRKIAEIQYKLYQQEKSRSKK